MRYGARLHRSQSFYNRVFIFLSAHRGAIQHSYVGLDYMLVLSGKVLRFISYLFGHNVFEYRIHNRLCIVVRWTITKRLVLPTIRRAGKSIR